MSRPVSSYPSLLVTAQPWSRLLVPARKDALPPLVGKDPESQVMLNSAGRSKSTSIATIITGIGHR